MGFNRSRWIRHRVLPAFLYIFLLGAICLNALAAPKSMEEALAEAEERKSLPIQTNQIENWPAGPAIGAQSAILMDANTGVILYSKNIHQRLYPASTTKLLTCLIAVENSQLNETVTFSHDAVFSLEPGSSNIGIDENQSMTMEECLYGILVASANEVANAVAEHVGGSMESFADMMNEKASELGCRDSHFVNAHGLHDEEHYTSAYDLCLIARAFFQNELLSKLGNTTFHHFEATPTQPDDFVERNKHRLITGEIPYEGVKGGKTGYTDDARQTLVTCAEQNGMKLICVILKEESPEQFYDTVKLLDYGFTNFSAVNVAENETDYSIQNSNFFNTSSDVFGNSKPILSLNPNSYLIMPKAITFKELDSEISYDTTVENEVAVIDYYYHDAYVGTATVDLAVNSPASYDFAEDAPEAATAPEADEGREQRVIVINIKTILIIVLIIAVILIAIFVVQSIFKNYSVSRSIRASSRRKRMRKRSRKDGPHFPSSPFNGF